MQHSDDRQCGSADPSSQPPSVPVSIDPDRVVAAFHRACSENDELVAQVLQRQVPCFVMGRNAHAENLLSSIEVIGVIDDFEQARTEWHGRRIYRSEDLPEGAVVINCSTSISPISAGNRIRSIPGVSCVPLADLYRPEWSPVPLPDFVREAREAVAECSTLYPWLFSRFHDSESQYIFNQLMTYRLTGDYAYMQGFTTRLRDQYFEPFLGDLMKASFVDCGGFDGDTTEEFISRYPQYGKVYLFEPSIANIAKAKMRLDQERDIEFVPLGISDEEGLLRFDSGAGSASAVSEEGASEIRVTTLDSYTDERLSFIKMDLEGWETKALRGARHHIQKDRPILAIAVYHHITDFWRIPEFILSVYPGYRVYLRHYTEGWSESVMYFVP